MNITEFFKKAPLDVAHYTSRLGEVDFEGLSTYPHQWNQDDFQSPPIEGVEMSITELFKKAPLDVAHYTSRLGERPYEPLGVVLNSTEKRKVAALRRFLPQREPVPPPSPQGSRRLPYKRKPGFGTNFPDPRARLFP
ncbi:hypothetical protein KSP40_PGU000459 [Platanthera guangdongensis]|uniref:Uncharacterized protein n=1 Tax=Platanthera guangdongensis TaxID=2320717 RepID=A0ABR2MI99_9ASPA